MFRAYLDSRTAHIHAIAFQLASLAFVSFFLLMTAL